MFTSCVYIRISALLRVLSLYLLFRYVQPRFQFANALFLSGRHLFRFLFIHLQKLLSRRIIISIIVSSMTFRFRFFRQRPSANLISTRKGSGVFCFCRRRRRSFTTGRDTLRAGFASGATTQWIETMKPTRSYHRQKPLSHELGSE